MTTLHLTSRYFEAPHEYRPTAGDPTAVFLGGGITGCPNWQEAAARRLLRAGLVVLNPRRAVGFAIDDPTGAPAQIAWEHRHLHLPGVLTLLWFAVESVQPIALLELGAALGEGRALVVGAHPGYPRRLDVQQVQLARPGTLVYAALDDVLDRVVELTGGQGAQADPARK
ncbi:nucleoside 2-deoxyribosyltransferase domain-containing protein [Kitasatospora sp. GAS1066B]|uniref:nucleoside 2-deoxyribosyltransferase domain-containing protein n=1 Tax=Kitasatospora sp. GAS1066B TaxID=3156271 RepID=UPI003514AC08